MYYIQYVYTWMFGPDLANLETLISNITNYTNSSNTVSVIPMEVISRTSIVVTCLAVYVYGCIYCCCYLCRYREPRDPPSQE